jgi:ribonuclease J
VLESVIAKAARRVIVASFSSHVHRVQQVIDAAHAHGRRVAFLGRSMVRNMTIAEQLGYLHVPENVLIDYKKARDLPDDQIVYMSTGSQGEPMAVLSRMANLDHAIEVGEGDTVILASSLIPGNENAVYRVIDGLTRLGANVVHKANAKVHVSGHAAITGSVECGYVYVDGSSVGDLTETELKDRRILGDEGFISVIVVIDSTTGKIVTGPEIHARGLAEDDAVFDEVQPRLVSSLEEALAEGAHDTSQLQQVMRRTVGSFAGRKLRRRPMIIPIVLEA